MQFSIIYSVDIPGGVDMRPFVPPNCKKLWEETEDDSNYEYGYLEGRWEHGHHRKWCAILNEDQFQEFLDHTGLFPENCQTMGSIGILASASAGFRPSRSAMTTRTLSSRPTSPQPAPSPNSSSSFRIMILRSPPLSWTPRGRRICGRKPWTTPLRGRPSDWR